MVLPPLAAGDVQADAGIMTRSRAIALDPQEIDGLPSLCVDPGHRLGPHTHRRHHHDCSLVAGHADVLGRWLGAGSHVHIPAGVEHDIDAIETEGCTMYFEYTLVQHYRPDR